MFSAQQAHSSLLASMSSQAIEPLLVFWFSDVRCRLTIFNVAVGVVDCGLLIQTVVGAGVLFLFLKLFVPP